MRGIISKPDAEFNNKIDVHIYDGDKSAMLFDSDFYDTMDKKDVATLSTDLNIFGRTWLIESVTPNNATFDNYKLAWIVGTSGTLLGAALYVILALALGLYTTAEGMADELTERIRERNTELSEFAYYDPLTHLPNRRMLSDRLNQALLSSQRNQLHQAILFIDLDNFKPLNDTHGHEMGDVLLMEASTRLRACVRDIDTVARIGGDEFVVILKDINNNYDNAFDNANKIANKILKSMGREYLLHSNVEDKDIHHTCTASIGGLVFMGTDKDAIKVLKQADSAMYLAKKVGGNTIKFHEGIDKD
jgi:diguanylate cyclase (GGDEF)-like protein